MVLTDEMKANLTQHPTGVRFEDPDSKKVYFIVEEATFNQAMDAVHRRDVIEAAKQGMADYRAGRCYSPDEAHELIRESLGLPRTES